ncbi:MAG: PleD family two-component system response regulator, partial [Chlamydiales bacterium]
VFLDLLMPEIDGNETLREIRKKPQFAKTPVLFLTARTVTQKERAELIGLGAQGIYVKPIDPVALVEKAVIMVNNV